MCECEGGWGGGREGGPGGSRALFCCRMPANRQAGEEREAGGQQSECPCRWSGPGHSAPKQQASNRPASQADGWQASCSTWMRLPLCTCCDSCRASAPKQSTVAAPYAGAGRWAGWARGRRPSRTCATSWLEAKTRIYTAGGGRFLSKRPIRCGVGGVERESMTGSRYGTVGAKS